MSASIFQCAPEQHSQGRGPGYKYSEVTGHFSPAWTERRNDEFLNEAKGRGRESVHLEMRQNEADYRDE